MKAMLAASAAVLFALPAFAQDAQPSRTKSEPPAPAEDDAAAPRGKAMKAGQISASNLLNETVVNEANESVGDVNDVIIDSDGDVAAVVVGVGGFLGMGEKNVALPFKKLKFAIDNNNDLVVTTDAAKESLPAAPAYDTNARD